MLHRGMVTENRIRLTGLLMRSPRIVRASQFLCALIVAGGVAAAPPSVSAPIPTQPEPLARTLAQTTADLEQAIGAWKPKSIAAPQPVVLQALYQQRIYRLLTRDSRLATRTFALVPKDLAKVGRDLVAAQRELYRLTPPIGVHAIKVGRPRPAPELLSYYPIWARRKCPRGARRNPRRSQLPPRFRRTAGSTKCTAPLRPLKRIRRCRASLRAAHQRRPQDVLRVVQLAGLRQDSPRRSSRDGAGSAVRESTSPR